MWFKDLELESENITRTPLTMAHADALVNAATDGELWKLWFTSVPNAETISEYIATALEQKSKGLSLPFVLIQKASGKVIGSTRFCNADFINQRVEIGYAVGFCNPGCSSDFAQNFQASPNDTQYFDVLIKEKFGK